MQQGIRPLDACTARTLDSPGWETAEEASVIVSAT